MEVLRRDASRKLPDGLSGRSVVVERLSPVRCVAIPFRRLGHDEITKSTASPALLASLLSCSRFVQTQKQHQSSQNKATTREHPTALTRATPPCHVLLSDSRGSSRPQNRADYVRTRNRPESPMRPIFPNVLNVYLLAAPGAGLLSFGEIFC